MRLWPEPYDFRNVISVQVQTVDDCTRRCLWCPNSVIDKTGDVIDDDVFLKILTELQKINYQGSIHPYLMAEPLLDPKFSDRIKTIRKMFPYNNIYIGSNGDLIEGRKTIESLLDAGIDDIFIAHYDDANDRLWDFNGEFPNVVQWPLERLRPTFYNRGGLVDVICEDPHDVCAWTISKVYINYRGDVISCCSDYNFEIVYGNIMKKSFMEIWNSDLYRLRRKMHLEGKGKKLSLCKNCNRLKGDDDGT